MGGQLRAELSRLDEAARSLATAWHATVSHMTSLGQERALLRLIGVDGLDREGRPLAAEIVDRYANEPGRLAGGILLPFAMALVEYDLAPRELALDAASGIVDLGLEAELLGQPERRAAAELEAARLVDAAIERLDANRTARRELVDLLGDAPHPWLGTTLLEASAGRALEEATRSIQEGVDVLRVEVPPGREVRRLDSDDAGVAFPGEVAGGGDDAAAPAGSHRGLRHLRNGLDRVAAERRGYVRLAMTAPALGAPEQAVVAGFERVDLVEADVMTEIVERGIAPDRALADHAFADRVHRRSGAQLLVGGGPLVVVPDLAAGQPSASPTRSGRALALQLLGVAFARAGGLPAAQVIVGGLPDWLLDEREPAARAVAEVALRGALFPGHPLLIEEPGRPEQVALWEAVLAAMLGPETALVLRRAPSASLERAVATVRAASRVAAELGGPRSVDDLPGTAAEHAWMTAVAARDTVERLREDGWSTLLGEGGPNGAAGAGEAVAERRDRFDPLAAAVAASG